MQKFALVEQKLAALELKLLQAVYSPVDLLTRAGTHLVQAGGKRLRPALCLICARQGDITAETAVLAATAPELTHMATLVHDDVIDEAVTRRGAFTVSYKWGRHAVVLAGDYLFPKAFMILSEVERQTGLYLYKNMADTVKTMCEGEFQQVMDAFELAITEEAYLTRIGKKTAVFFCCKL